MSDKITGLKQIEAAFAKPGATFMPYFTLGYPDMITSIEIVEACVANGADLMELGVPFSDPLADGPTIQHSTQVALENGVTVKACLDAVKQLRGRGVVIPLMLMGYYNPIIAFGVEEFVREAAEVGVSGFIIPDLPPEEADEIRALCENYGLAIVFLLSPNSSDERIEKVVATSTGFTYLVSVLGITGARDQFASNLAEFVNRVKAKASTPVAVGFGISTPAQAANVAKMADGVIVGSALIKGAINSKNPAEAAGEFVAAMVAGMKE